MTSNRDCSYDPRISSLVARTDEDWGEPQKNQEDLIWYGINEVDQALWGLDFERGELVGIQAEAKQRKTTMLANVVLHVAGQAPRHGFWSVIDSLESGMPPETYRDMLVAIGATRILVSSVYGKSREGWPVWKVLHNDPVLGSDLKISRHFLRYGMRSPRQQQAIDMARAGIGGLPIMIFGPAKSQGSARDLNLTVARWDRLYNGDWPTARGCPVRLFCMDHIQQMNGGEWGTNDYMRLEAVVDALSNFVTGHPGTVVICVSQMSTTSVRLEKQGMGRAQAKGGGKLEAEANVIFRTKYDRDIPHVMTISVDATRRQPPPPVFQELDPSSGAFLRPAHSAV